MLRAGYRRFLKAVSPRVKINFRALYYLFVLAAIAIFLVFLIDILSIGRVSLGEFGDFFGGVLNPILTFLTFMGLLITIVIQQTELRESRQELRRSADALSEQVSSIKRQNFESTFFNMMNLHGGIVDSIDLSHPNGKITKGRDCFVIFYRRIGSFCLPDDSGSDEGRDEIDVLREGYSEFWEDHQLELGHYFRFLYNMLRFIKESGFVDGPYVRLVRAQLSDQELLVIFYNCIASRHGGTFKLMAEEFSLFDNMPQDRVLSAIHLTYIDPKALSSQVL